MPTNELRSKVGKRPFAVHRTTRGKLTLSLGAQRTGGERHPTDEHAAVPPVRMLCHQSILLDGLFFIGMGMRTMDRISKSLLDEFSSEHALKELPEDKRFEHFAAYLCVGRHLADSFETAEVVVGEGADTGIDAIGILVNGALVADAELIAEFEETNGYLDATFVFVQAERTSGFDGAKIGQFLYGVQDFFKEAPALPRGQAVADAAEVMSALYARVSKFKRGNPACRLYYVTTGKWVGDANLEARRRTAIDDLQGLGLFRDVEFTPVGADSIQKLYNQTKNAVSREFTFTARTVVPEMPGVTEAYIGLLPAKEFLSIVEEDDGELLRSIFYDNVRDWQDYNVVNSEMRETLASPVSRTRFALMNNGITVIAKTLRATGNKFYIEDFQVVNGCQTSHVLHGQRTLIDDSVMVPLRLIATQDEEVIASIVKATNRQTEVKEEQLLALSDFQKRLEAFFLSYPESQRLFYERRSRQYNSVAGIEKTRIVTPASLIRSFASVFLEEPHRTTRSYGALRNMLGKTIFGSDHKLEPYYLAAFSLYRLEYLFRNQVLDAKFKPARYHVLLAARLLVTSERPPNSVANAMVRYCHEMLDVLWDPATAQALLVRAAGAVDSVAQGDFHRDNIRTEPFTDSLKKACALLTAV